MTNRQLALILAVVVTCFSKNSSQLLYNYADEFFEWLNMK